MWLWSAERLFFGAQTLWGLAAKHSPLPRSGHPAERGQFPVALLLYGYAIENALKGLIAQQCAASGTPVRTTDGKLKEIPTKGHPLRELAGRAKVPLAEDEADLLDRLKEFVMWAGRYPTTIDTKGRKSGTIVPNARSILISILA